MATITFIGVGKNNRGLKIKRPEHLRNDLAKQDWIPDESPDNAELKKTTIGFSEDAADNILGPRKRMTNAEIEAANKK